MTTDKPDPNEPHVFQEVVIMPMTTGNMASLDAPGSSYSPPITPFSAAPQCGVCHRAKDDRLHIAAEANDSEHWPV